MMDPSETLTWENISDKPFVIRSAIHSYLWPTLRRALGSENMVKNQTNFYLARSKYVACGGMNCVMFVTLHVEAK